MFREIMKKITKNTIGKLQRDSKKDSGGQGSPEVRKSKLAWLRKRHLMFTSKGNSDLSEILKEFNEHGEKEESIDSQSYVSTNLALYQLG